MIRAIAIWLLCVTVANAQYLVEQPPDAKPANLGQAIGRGAVDAWALQIEVAELRGELQSAKERIAVLETLVPPYQPTWTWPGSETATAFDRLREHLREHGKADVSKWSRAECAYAHDCEHLQELLDSGKPLPVLKDQRLRDWLRAKSPAKALPKKLGWAVKRIVMHTRDVCPACTIWKRDELPKAQADGVTVEIKHEGRGFPGASYPYFEVDFCSDTACQTRSYGYVSYETIKSTQL